MTISFRKWSERQQVLAVILGGGLFLSALWFFLLTPLNRQRRALEKDIEQIRTELAAKGLLLDMTALNETRQQAYDEHKSRRAEWLQAAGHIQSIEESGAGIGGVGHIDYKVALFDVRHRLQRKARALNVVLPADLGMEAAIRSNEDARERMYQLRAVERLVDLCLDVNIPRLQSIAPLEPNGIMLPGSTTVYMREYPVKLEFLGSMDNLYALFETVAQPGRLFALRQCRIESTVADTRDILEISLTLSALLSVVEPDELTPAAKAPVQRLTRPLGF